MTNVSKLPEPGVILDLDLEERDPKDVKDPFRAKVAGRVIEFKDPELIDWRDLAAVEIPGDLIRVALSEEDRDFMRGLEKLETWKFGRLMKAYYSYHNLQDKIREAQSRQVF